MSNTRELDLIIWGATGFTGQLVSEYISKQYTNSTLKWGIAGRNKEKVLSVAKRLNIDEEKIFIADRIGSSRFWNSDIFLYRKS